MGCKSLTFLVTGIFISQPVEAHRKYRDDTTKSPVIVESDDTADYNITSEGAVTKKKDNAKKLVSSDQNKNVASKENSTISKDNSSSTQMPTALKGVGIPGSPHQVDVPHANEPKDNKLKEKVSKNSEGSNEGRGHLITILRPLSD